MKYLQGILLSLLLIGLAAQATAQSYSTRTAHLNVKSSSTYMDVEADNYQVYSTVDFENKTVDFVGLMKSWEFGLGALDRAFNSDHLDLSGYPKFSFKGNISADSNIDLNTPGRYELEVKGNLFIGQYKRVTSATAICYVKDDGKIDVESDFSFMIEEANMEVINKLMKERIPQLITIDANTLGISREISTKLYLTYSSN